MLAAGALVASLLAVGASPAAAVNKDSKANRLPATKACVGPALADAGFTDTAGLGAEEAINCLAYYGITTGKTADKFDPGSNVTRSQMALFLHRTATVAGVDLSKGGAMPGFSDLADESADRRAAINALASNGILMGRGATTFMPTADITRAEMAHALINLLAKVAGSGVVKNKNGTFTVTGLNPTTGAATGAVTGTDLDVFTDAFASTSVPVNSAISSAYEMGITTGKSLDVFDPAGSVPRKNMASFITRALAHTNARPAGVTAQAVVGNKVKVSVRDANFAPVANAVIDAFKIDDISMASKAFKSDGTCSAANSVKVEAATLTKCGIDSVDPVTGSEGNLTLDVTANAKGTVVWVWTGNMGDKVSATTDLYELEVTVAAAAPTAAARAQVSTDFAGGYDAEGNLDSVFRAKFGSTVTFTIQLKAEVDKNGDGDTDDPGEANQDAAPDADGDSYKVTITYGPTSSRAGTVLPTTYKVGSGGSATFSLSDVDPNPTGTTADSVVVTWKVDVVDSDPSADTTKNSPGLTVGTTGSGADSITGTVTFSDAKSVLHKVTAKVRNKYSPKATADSPNTGNRVMATTTDQYGDAMAGVKVSATTNVTADSGCATCTSTFPTAKRVTDGNGNVDIGWSYTSRDAQVETVTVKADGADDESESDDRTTTVMAYWTQAGTTTEATGALLTATFETKTLVINVSSAPTVYVWDANDQFADASGPITMAAFETAVADRLKPGATAGNVTVASYKPGDSSDVARFTLS